MAYANSRGYVRHCCDERSAAGFVASYPEMPSRGSTERRGRRMLSLVQRQGGGLLGLAAMVRVGLLRACAALALSGPWLSLASCQRVASPGAAAPARPSSCAQAAKLRGELSALLAAGKLDRTARTIARADRLCPASAHESWAVLTRTLVELGRLDEARALAGRIERDPRANADARGAAEEALRSAQRPWTLEQAEAALSEGLALRARGAAAEAQKGVDRALAALEQRTGQTLTVERPAAPGFWSPFAWSRDGSRFAIGELGSARVFDAHSGLELERFELNDATTELWFSADGARLNSGAREAGVEGLNDPIELATGRRLEHGPGVLAGAIRERMPRQIVQLEGVNRIAYLDLETHLHLEQTDPERELASFPNIANFAASADGRRLALARFDFNQPTVGNPSGWLDLRDTATGKLVRSFFVAAAPFDEVREEAAIFRSIISPDNGLVVIETGGRYRRAFVVSSGRSFELPRRHLDLLGATADGFMFAEIPDDTDQQATLFIVGPHGVTTRKSEAGLVPGGELLPNGTEFLTALWCDDRKQHLALIDTSTGRLKIRFGPIEQAPMQRVYPSPSGQSAVVQSEPHGRTRYLLDLTSGALTPIFRAGKRRISELALQRSDGALFVTSDDDTMFWLGGRVPNGFRVLPSMTGTVAKRLRVRATASLSDGRLALICQRGGDLLVLDGQSLDVLLRIHEPGLGNLGVALAGSTLVAVEPEAVNLNVYQFPSGKPLGVIPLRDGTEPPFALSPDGTRLVLTSETDGPLQLWNTATGAKVADLASTRYVAFSSDGTRVLVSSAQRSASFDAASGAPLPASDERVYSSGLELATAVTPDGLAFVVETEDTIGLRRMSEPDRDLVSVWLLAGKPAAVVLGTSSFDVLGDEAAVDLVCQIGPFVVPWQACEDRLRVRGLFAKALAAARGAGDAALVAE